MLMRSRTLLSLFALAVALVAPTQAGASQLIARDAKGVQLRVNAKGEALLGYTTGGKRVSVLAWGAVNAVAPTQGGKQVAFKLDYAGGWGKYRKVLSVKTFKNVCGPYTGPPLPWLVTACTAPDGSHWALQSWQKAPARTWGSHRGCRSSRAWELYLSHWTTELPKLEMWANWAYSKRFDHVFGRFTYLGQPVFGFSSTAKGEPTDSFGRNIYLDTYDSAYGSGWKRENSFLTHRGHRGVLLRLLRTRPVPRVSCGRSAPAGQGNAVSRHRARAGRDARRQLGGAGARRLRRRARPAAARDATPGVRRRSALQAALTSPSGSPRRAVG